MRRISFAWPVCSLLAACAGNSGDAAADLPAPGDDPALTSIQAIQGSDPTSPLVGQIVTTTGIVTGDFQDGDADTAHNLGGFYLQGATDADPATSDAVFVFDGNSTPLDVSVGDAVRVTGTVREYFGETQLAADTVIRTGTGTIDPTPLHLPAGATAVNADGALIGDLEALEGMLVRFSQTLTVAELWKLEDYGSIVLTANGNQYQYTSENPPDVDGFRAHNQAIALARITLDDGQRSARPATIPYLPVRVGDQVTGLTGVLRYSRDSGGRGFETYRLEPIVQPQFDSTNPRPAVPVITGTLRVASFNVLQWFSTIDTGARVCGPDGDGACLGANNVEERNRQLSKIVTALGMIDADIVGLLELENNASESLQLLVDALNDAGGDGSYAYVDTGTTGPQPIKCGIIYKPATVSPVGVVAVLDSAADPRFDVNLSRPVLAQTFAQNSDGATLTLAVAHLKSKGSPCDKVGDPDAGDGQANCNLTRTRAATALVEWLATHPTGSADADTLIIGDMNSHFFEDPLAVLENAGYVNVLVSFVGKAAYSFVFDGQRGALDHALASRELVPQVVAVSEWHINADEAPVLDYNLEDGRNPALFDAAIPYRASDHDPLIVGLDLDP